MNTTVDIWCCFPGAVRDAKLLNEYKRLLSSDEMGRYERYRFDSDKHLHLVAWALVRTALSRYAGIEPRAWRFRTNEYGRPEIVGPRSAPPLRFNLSHTRGLVACIVAEEVDVGVDVEDRRRDIAGVDIARRYFSARELAAFERAPAARRQRMFFEYWTLKEAYIKAVGVGISLGLGRFSFDLDDTDPGIGDNARQAPRISFHHGIEDDPASWQFAQFEPSPTHTMAAAIRRGAAPPFDIRLHETVPGSDNA